MKPEFVKLHSSLSGVFKITNTQNGMFFLDFAANIQAKQNSFTFMVSTGAFFQHKLQKNWEAFGSRAFTFEVLETLEKNGTKSGSVYG
jgi:hypothetical protein